MACGFDKGLVAAHYDGETTPEERLLVERHLATCAECAADLSSMRGLSASLKPLKGAAAPMSIAEGVMREIQSSRRAPRPWISWGLSAAAALFLAAGTVYMLDRRAAPVRDASVALSEPARANQPNERRFAAKELSENKSREELHKEAPAADSGLAQKPADPPPAPPPPAAELEKREADGRREEFKDKDAPAKKDESTLPLGKAKEAPKPAVPVLRVTAANVALARLEVEAFLSERELAKSTPGAPLLGRGAVRSDRYLQIELSEEESKELEKRLASLKGTEVTPGIFEDEKKRVAEEEAKLKYALGSRTGEDDKETEKTDKAEAGALRPQASQDRARGMAAKPAVQRKKIILVFEPAPAKK